MTAVILALMTAASWGVSDFLGGLKTRALPLLVVLLVSQAAGAVLMLVLVAAHHTAPSGSDFILYGFLGGCSAAIALSAFYQGMAIGVISIVAPIAATSPVVPVIVGLALGERPTSLQLAGVVLAILGVIVLSLPANGLRAFRTGSPLAVTLALIAALMFGGFFLALHAVGDTDLVWGVMVQRVTAALIILGAVLVFRPPWSMTRRDLPALGTIGILDVGGTMLFAAASTMGLLSLVSVLASLHPVGTIALARAVLGERLTRLQWVGVAIAVVGVILIST